MAIRARSIARRVPTEMAAKSRGFSETSLNCGQKSPSCRAILPTSPRRVDTFVRRERSAFLLSGLFAVRIRCVQNSVISFWHALCQKRSWRRCGRKSPSPKTGPMPRDPLQFKVPISVQIGVVAALFIAALVVLWITGASVVARERRRSDAKGMLEQAGDQLAARGRESIALGVVCSNIPMNNRAIRLDRRAVGKSGCHTCFLRRNWNRGRLSWSSVSKASWARFS